jgi:phage tail-like protein
MYYKKYAFRVEIDGFTTAAFRTAGPLKASVATIEEREGGSRKAKKELGLVTFDNITLEKGATDNRDMWDWMKKSIDGDTASAKRNMSIVQLNPAGTEIERWNIFGAMPVAFEAGSWDNNADENLVRSLEIAVEDIEID